MKRLFFCLTVTLFICSSCEKDKDKTPDSFLSGNGVFILNEGNFGRATGSISFYSYDSVKMFNNIFLNANQRPLGDVPNSMLISGDKIFVVVNNSGKVEVVEKESFKSIATISDINSPRDIAEVSSTKAYVTSMYSDSVIVIDTKNDVISGYINIRRTSESIVVRDKRAYIANCVGGNEIMVINTDTDKVIDSIKVAAEPESMVFDKNGMLWVLCNGGWAKEKEAELLAVNIASKDIKSLPFPSMADYPSCLRIDGTGSTLYFLNSAVQKLSIDDTAIPSGAFISSYFYNLGINPTTGDVLVTDALDYQQQGNLLIYNSAGSLSATHEVGIIPGKMYFTTSK